MWSAAFVFACALDLLGRSASSFPPVEFVAHPPPGVSMFAQGFVRPGTRRIVLVTSTDAFTTAGQNRCKDTNAIREIASVLVHEEWHLLHGPDEAGAYDAQMIALLATGADVDGPLFHRVKQAKLAVLAAEKRNRAASVVASAR